MLALPLFLTSCDDILGEWSKPTPTIITPETPVKVTSITLNKPATTLNVGATETLTVETVAPDNATDKSVTWSSDNTAAATVDENGLVTAKGVGSATITATAKDGSGAIDKCTVTVSVPGLLTGEFSIAADKKVRFSKGNLQAKTEDYGTNWTWNFAENQWDCIGNAAGNTKVTATTPFISDNGIVDLFGWVGASSSWDEVNKYGITSSTTVDAEDGYGKNSDEALKADWGTLAISNGGNTPNYGWFTLSKAEWEYVLKNRDSGNTDDARFAKAKLFDTTYGLIIFPDNYKHPADVADYPTGINKEDNTSWDANKFNAADWAKMEAAGCVFLPAAGRRENSPSLSVAGVGTDGIYWSSSKHFWSNVYLLSFSDNHLFPDGSGSRDRGYSVRLVYEVK